MAKELSDEMVREALEKSGGSIAAAGRSLGVNVASFGKRVRRMRNDGRLEGGDGAGAAGVGAAREETRERPARAAAGRGISSAEFLAQFDIPGKIMEACKRHLEGRGQVYAENEFRVLCDVTALQFSRAKQEPEFEGYQMRVKGKTYWASPETIEAARKRMKYYCE